MDKKIHRFLVESIPEAPVFTITTESLVHQLFHVLRLIPGESIILFVDRGHDIEVRIQSISKKEITVEKGITYPIPTASKRTVYACISMIRKERFETAVEKLTELGVHTIVPILSHRTVRQNIRIDRLQAISDEALEQSGGTMRVHIHEPLSLEDALHTFPHQTVVCSPQGDSAPSLKDTVTVYIGPEGGWSTEDEALFATHTPVKMALGNRVLRTETAAIISAYRLLWE